MKGKQDLVLACECGTTLRMSSLDETEIEDYRTHFATEHKYHQPVTPNEARILRYYDREQRNRHPRNRQPHRSRELDSDRET